RLQESAQRRGEFDDVAVVVLEEAQAAADRLEVDRVAEDLDAAGAELVERVDRLVAIGGGAAEDLDLGGAVAEVGELHVAERPLQVDGEVELVLVPDDGAGVVDGADRDVVVAEL